MKYHYFKVGGTQVTYKVGEYVVLKPYKKAITLHEFKIISRIMSDLIEKEENGNGKD